MIIHIIQSTVNNFLNALAGEGEGGKTDTSNIIFNIYQLWEVNTQHSAHKPIIKDAYSGYCRDKLTRQKLPSPASLILHADQLGLSGTVQPDTYTASRCLLLPRQGGPGLLSTVKAMYFFPILFKQISLHYNPTEFLHLYQVAEFSNVLMQKYTIATHLKLYLEFRLPA